MSWLGTAIATAGALLCLVAAIGLFRLPGALARLTALSKASTLGLVLTVIGAVVLWPVTEIAIESAFVVVFTILVAPVSAHLIGRATYRCGLVDALEVDELRADELATDELAAERDRDRDA
jgi:multicomponent Na+:H+ antiporter subunit G